MSTDWKVYVYDDSSGGDWVLDYDNLRRPNANLTMESTSTYTTDILIDSSKAVTIPEVTGYYSPIQLFWEEDDFTLYTKFKGYQQEGSYLKITTHNNDFIFYGRVVGISADWLAGAEYPGGGDTSDLLVIIDRTNVMEPT